ncbi:uncharacterized protein LOC130446077 [Diorhabda sublineata]|uniref:uncharacterized protein LOC130446077 n=1 Tax=Diorhabda sublineata TaxID=1163346 RepID=UPI0024E064A4|nr:uncharacterized protein LOC130446077 [Diorhabda sublineata]
MAGKPDLSAATGIQNVIVYVSDDNFAQAYSLGQQNVQETNHIVQGNGYDTLSNQNTSMVGPAKAFREKPTIKLVDYGIKQQQVDNIQQREYYNNTVPQSRPGYNYPPLPQSEYSQNIVNDGTFHNGNCENVDILQQEGKQTPGSICNNVRVREDCSSCETYVEQDYTKVVGTDIPVQGMCYDTVRLEAADSSCSSLSSSDDGSQVLPNQTSEMVVYDPNINLQSGNVVLTVGSPLQQQQQLQLQQQQMQQQSNNQLIDNYGTLQRPTITVPYGWKRLLNNGSVIYISPSCTALRSPDQIKEYLLTAGTCKCGLECHFKHESVFNFDPKVIGKPYVMQPDSKSNMTKLCNHKRKIMPLVPLEGPPLDSNIKFQRELGMKKKKRRIGLPYIDGVPVSQLMTHREKVALNQNTDKAAAQQVFSDYPANNQQQNHVIKYQDQQGNRVILGDSTVMVQQSNINNDIPSPDVIKNDPPVHQMNNMPVYNSQPRQVMGSNGQILHVRGPANNQGNVYHMPQPPGPRMITQMPKVDQPEEHRIFISRQPTEPTGPGRPQHIQIVRVNAPNTQKVMETHQMVDRNQPKRHMQPLQPQFCNPQQYQQVQLCAPHRHVRPYNQANTGFRPHRMVYQPNQNMQAGTQPNMQKVNWSNQMLRRSTTIEQQKHLVHQQKQLEQQQLEQQQKQLEQQQQNQANICERVPPLYQHTPPVAVCQEDMRRKKVKMGKFTKNRPYRLVEGSCTNNHFSCPNIDIRHIPQENRSVMMNNFSQNIKSSSPSFMEDPSGYLAQQTALLNNTINRQTGATGCAGFTCNSPGSLCQNPLQQNLNSSPTSSPSQELPPSNNVMINESVNNLLKTSRNNFSSIQQEACKPISPLQQNNIIQVQPNFGNNKSHQYSAHCRCCVTEGFQVNYPVKTGRPSSSNVPGTLDDPVTSSTSFEKQFNQNNVDIQPIQGGTVSTSNISPMDNNSDPPTPERMVDNSQISSTGLYAAYNQVDHTNEFIGHNRSTLCKDTDNVCCFHSQASPLVTTMASSRTVGSNTITSVLAGRTNTTTTSLNTPSSITGSFVTRATGQNTSTVQSQPVTKSPLEMVQSIVSSIQIPNISQPSQIVKEAIPQEQHILVSSGEQVIMGGSNEDVHAPQKVMTNEGMPPVTVSPMVTNVTSSVGTVIPAVGQQVLGQQTVLVNALPAPFVLQPGISMTMEGVPVGQNLQLPQFVTGNIIQQPIQIDNTEGRRMPPLLSPDTKKKGKKRKEPAQTVANMLQFATQQNPSVVLSPQGFPQQIQMNSPQSVTATPVMQAVTIVPNKTGAPAQIIMSDPSMTNSNLGTQQLITNSQSQQINLLQPVNLINGTGMVQNFPAIHQFIVPNLGGMVVNPDGTATILQDTSNLGMQLQFQNVNGQNMLTSVQNNTLFNNGQTIFATGPSGMVIRTPTSQGKLIQQQHSPVAQFLSPNGGQFIMNGSQFSGQLSPLVASVSPNQQVTFNSPPQQIRSNNSLQPPQQEYIHMNGQTLIVPCSPASTIPVSNQTSNQNTTFLQQNTTIVQQQTTMLTNQGLQNFPNNQQGGSKSTMLNSSIEESRESPKSSSHCRQSVSTQTAVNQNVQAIITNTSCQTSTISASSPPDTTTMSPVPVASEMQSPILADTTTHNDDGLSPVPLSCSTGRNESNIRSESQSCTMAMVHCISSSEPDPSDMQNLDHDWKQSLQASSSSINGTYTDMTHIGKISTSPTHLVSAESSSLVTSLHYGVSDQEPISSSKHFDRKKTATDCCVVMETHHEQVSLFGGSADALNQNELEEEIEDNGADGNGQGSEGEEDDDPNEGYLVGSLLINS